MNHFALKNRFEFWRWSLPASLIIVVLLYQLVLARWVHNTFNDATHFAVEILFFATVGPALTFLALTRIGRWLAEKERATEQARANERWLASITAASADAILSLDPQGHIDSWNHGAELLFGYTAAEMHGRSLAAIFGPGETAEVEVHWLNETVRRDGLIRGHETTVRCADGRRPIVELTATHITDDQDHTLGVSLIHPARHHSAQAARTSLRAPAFWVLVHTATTGGAALLLGTLPSLGWLYLLPTGLVVRNMLWRNGRHLLTPAPCLYPQTCFCCCC